MKRTQLAGLTGLLALSGVGGYVVCGNPDCEDPGYLTVNVVQADGDGFKPASVPALEYTVAPDPRGGAPDDRAAAPTSGTCIDDACTKWKVAPGDNGEIHLKAEVCGQSFEEVALVDRDEEGCNHGEKEVDLVIDLTSCSPGGGDAPTDIRDNQTKCTMEARPSVQLRTWKRHSDYFSPATPESVKFVYHGDKKPIKDQPPAACVDERCATWNVGVEKAGLFEILVTSCGKTQTIRADVKADECHVITEKLDLVLEGTQCLTNEVQGGGTPTTPPNKITDKPDSGSGGEGIPNPDGQHEPVPPTHGPDGHLDSGCNPGDPDGTAFVAYTVKQHGDMLVPVAVESLHYSVDGKGSHQAKCEGDPCNMWQGPGKGPGTYELTAPVCDKDTTLSFQVQAGAKGCGVATEYLMWDVDRSNCLSGVVPGDDKPTPGGPGDKLAAEPPAPETPKE
jgi:hypothetical protein